MGKKILKLLLVCLLIGCFVAGCTYTDSDTDAGYEEETALLEENKTEDENEAEGTEAVVGKDDEIDDETPILNETESATTTQTDDSTSSSSQSTSSQNTQSSTPSVTVPQQNETGANLVWVPVNGGTKYHSTSSCSNMKEPMQVTIDTAKANGYEACKRCY